MAMLDYGADQLLWPNLQPRFWTEFAIQSNDKLIEGLSNLAMKPSENTGGGLLNRIIDMMVIKESCREYQNKVQKPQNDVNGGMSPQTVRKYS